MKGLILLVHLIIVLLQNETIMVFNGSCLKQDKVTYNHEKTINIYIVYEIVKIIILAVMQH